MAAGRGKNKGLEEGIHLATVVENYEMEGSGSVKGRAEERQRKSSLTGESSCHTPDGGTTY